MPTSETILLTFVSHLALEGLAYTSIKVYLSAVRNMHVAAGLHEAFSSQMTPRLEMVLQGIKKEDAKKRGDPSSRRLPITIDIMMRIKSTLSLHPGNDRDILLWAACC